VDVNTLTGQVRVLRVVSAHDVGRAINRQKVEGQTTGLVAKRSAQSSSNFTTSSKRLNRVQSQERRRPWMPGISKSLRFRLAN
jgi:hypothetical protein